MHTESRQRRAWARWKACIRTLRTIIGVPDYDRYLRHMRAHHPECAVLAPDEFARQRLEARYSKPGSRCC
ncbi:MAG: YbdD/YjiX family protein [Gemmatimonadaceae bacterium]|nr:YbdD/YjiX family protein [Gemmatimonadaceae bacterium]